MTTDQESRFNVLLEDIQSQVRGLADATAANTATLARVETQIATVEMKVDRLEIKVDVLDRRVDALDRKVDAIEGRVEGLEGLAIDTKQRLTRIETHLGLNGSPKPTRKPAARKKRR